MFIPIKPRVHEMPNNTFANLPITKKLQRLQVITVSLALVFTLIFSTLTELWKQHKQIIRDAESIGEMIGYNAEAALAFDDMRSATEILSALYSKPEIMAARLYTLQDTPLAHYIADGRSIEFPHSAHEFRQQSGDIRMNLLTYELMKTVKPKNDVEGYLFLVVDLEPMWWGLAENLSQILAVMLSAFMLSALYGKRLAQGISIPLIKLAAIAQKVSKDQDYSVRAQGEGDDEIGQLVTSFNRMIEQVQERDAKLKRQQERLELEVDIRTRHLRRSMQQAQAANIAKSQFLATMSHEIRTPMNGVLGMTELLLGTELTTTQREYTETVYSSADSLLNIINDILDFSKIEAGKLELEDIDFSLADLVDQLSVFFFERAHAKNIELSCSLHPTTPEDVRGDPYRLRQVLTNVLSNAIKFTERGFVRLLVQPVSCKDHQLSADYCLEFSIRDTGIGISKESMPKLFKSFSQADGSTTRKFGGSGLGLAICKELCELMGGTISVSSELGVGTEFTIRLPIQKALGPVSTGSGICEDLRGKRVLVVEDNATNAKIMMNYLLGFGMNPRIAENGTRALELIAQAERLGRRFDVALIDMKMHGMTGAELTQLIRQEPKLNTMHTVIITSSAYENELVDIKASGCDTYLHKPLRKTSLQNVLQSLFSQPTTFDETRNRLQGIRVLLAEDNPVNQKIAKTMLNVMGCIVEIAENGIEALTLYEKQKFDVILMDCMMPEMDGYTASVEIRKREYEFDWPAVPIVALTANAMTGDREKCLQSGMNDYLAKPILQDVLRDKILTFVKPKASQLDDGVIANEVSIAPVEITLDNSVTRFDPAPLLTLKKMGGDDFVATILDLFNTSASEHVAKLREGLLSQDALMVQHAAHSLKSAAANVGGIVLADLARTIEQDARTGALSFDIALADELNKEFQLLLPLLSKGPL